MASQAADLAVGATRTAGRDPLWVRTLLIAFAVVSLGVLVVVPVVNVFWNALSGGIGPFVRGVFLDADTRHAILLTLAVAPAAVAVNTVFGIGAAWLIARHRFFGRTLLITILDLPFAVSPVVAGLAFVLIFGRQGYLGPWFAAHGIKILFAWPGLVLVTTFTTLPFVVRELIPVLEALGDDEEVAAESLGASAWQTFWYVTLPNIRWALLYGVILCNARAMGEFGAVYVVSGRITGQTDTITLQVEKLFQDRRNQESFALASLLTMLAAVTLVAKALVARLYRKDLEEAENLKRLQ